MQPIAYELTVFRGARQGFKRLYPANGKPQLAARMARRRAERLDLEYGAMCATVRTIWEA